MTEQTRYSGRFLLEVAAWEVGLLLVYLASLSAFSPSELVAGGLYALPAAALAGAARRAARASWRPAPGWATWLAWLPLAVPADTALLFRQLFRRNLVGRFRVVVLPHETAARQSARVALGG